jgi:HK97 family phage major capsid protein
VIAHDALMRVFEEYKATNDQRVAALETRGGDGLIDDKMRRLDAEVDAKMQRIERTILEARRPALGREMADGAVHAVEHKTAFEAYVRAGDAGGLRALETRAMSVGSGPDGGYLVPPQVEVDIASRLSVLSPIRAIADVRQVSSATYTRPFSKTGPQAGWAAETAARPQTDGATLAQQSFPTMELYAMPAATQTLIDDAAVDLEAWIASEVETVFAEQEGKAFVTGDGTGKPTGFLSVTQVANSAWDWGKIGTIATGAAAGFSATNPVEVLFDLIYAAKAGYRQNARFVMNRKTQSELRKFKDAGGSYVWTPPAQAGGTASLFTFPVVEAEDMPNIAAGTTPIAFGDFRRGYLVVDRVGMRILRDPYSAKPYVLFYTTKRVGGGVADFDAIKLLKVAAS